MGVDVRIITQLTGDAQARRGIKQIQGDVQNAEKSAQMATRSFTGFTAALRSVAPALGAATLVAGIGKIITVTSDAQEITSKFDAVYKGLADSVRIWARDTAAATNRSRFDFEKYLATLQDTFVPLGFARDQAAELSKTLVTLGVDLASFNNESEPDTINALTSAIVGNNEAVRRYGIVITQATLNQELLNQGVLDGVKGATEQEKALARVNIILQSTADAQGDAERTSESFSNQLRGLRAAVEELLIALGESGLLAVATEVVGALTDMARAATEVIETIKRLGEEPVQALKSLAQSTAVAAAEASIAGQIFRVYTDFVGENTEQLKENVEVSTAVAEATGKVTTATKDLSFAIDEETQFLIDNDMRMREALLLLQQMQEEEKAAAEAAKERAEQQNIAEKAALDAARERAKEACGFEKEVDDCGNEVWRKRRTRDKRFQRETIADLGFLKISACREIREQVQCTRSGQIMIEGGFRELFQRVATGTGDLGDRVRGVFETMVQGVQRALANLAADAIWNVITSIASSSGGAQFASTLQSGTRALRDAGGIPTRIEGCGAGFARECGGGGGGGGDAPQQEGVGILGGAATGAAIGSAFGPIGTVVGGVIGGIAGAFGFQRGGDFITQGPRLIGVGEAGPERVQITPLGGRSDGGVNIVLQGTTIMDEIGFRRFTRRIDRELGNRNRRRL